MGKHFSRSLFRALVPMLLALAALPLSAQAEEVSGNGFLLTNHRWPVVQIPMTPDEQDLRDFVASEVEKLAHSHDSPIYSPGMTPPQILDHDVLSLHVNDRHNVLVNFNESVARRYGTELEEFAGFAIELASGREAELYRVRGDVYFAVGGWDGTHFHNI